MIDTMQDTTLVRGDAARKKQARDIAQVAADIRREGRLPFKDMFEGIAFRKQNALIVTATIVDGGPATVTAHVRTFEGDREAVVVPRGDTLVRAVHDLFDRRCISNAVMTIDLGINRANWRVTIVEGDETSLDVSQEESLTTTSEEWAEVIILRDGAKMMESGDYVTRAMLRAVALMEQTARQIPEGYSRHWHMVDAEVLRLEVEKRVAQGLD